MSSIEVAHSKLFPILDRIASSLIILGMIGLAISVYRELVEYAFLWLVAGGVSTGAMLVGVAWHAIRMPRSA